MLQSFETSTNETFKYSYDSEWAVTCVYSDCKSVQGNYRGQAGIQVLYLLQVFFKLYLTTDN